mmetsp:Transcript_18879/g.41363  ORF Transcript_18879/g.41363 Transcript_18879/m.41363 type:complete len:371 (+) Transcript_18879:227-1339(+)
MRAPVKLAVKAAYLQGSATQPHLARKYTFGGRLGAHLLRLGRVRALGLAHLDAAVDEALDAVPHGVGRGHALHCVPRGVAWAERERSVGHKLSARHHREAAALPLDAAAAGAGHPVLVAAQHQRAGGSQLVVLGEVVEGRHQLVGTVRVRSHLVPVHVPRQVHLHEVVGRVLLRAPPARVELGVPWRHRARGGHARGHGGLELEQPRVRHLRRAERSRERLPERPGEADGRRSLGGGPEAVGFVIGNLYGEALPVAARQPVHAGGLVVLRGQVGQHAPVECGGEDGGDVDVLVGVVLHFGAADLLEREVHYLLADRHLAPAEEQLLRVALRVDARRHRLLHLRRRCRARGRLVEAWLRLGRGRLGGGVLR